MRAAALLVLGLFLGFASALIQTYTIALGSVRLPATHCGIFALKPSLGRVPVNPPYIGRVTGPMTRDVEASAMMMNWLSLPDARDFMSLPYRAVDFTAGLDSLDLKKLKIGFLPDMRAGMPVGQMASQGSGSRGPLMWAQLIWLVALRRSTAAQ